MLQNNWEPRLPCATCKHIDSGNDDGACKNCKYNEFEKMMQSGKFKRVEPVGA